MGNRQINYIVNLTELICLYVDLELEIKSTYLLFQDHKDKSQERKIVIQIYQKKKEFVPIFSAVEFPWDFTVILILGLLFQFKLINLMNLLSFTRIIDCKI